MEQADGVGAAADTGEQRIRQPAFKLHHLLAGFLADHALEIAHHGRIGMRPGGGADAVKSVVDIGDPVAQSLVHGVLERARPGLDRNDLGAEQVHAEDIGLLPLDIDRAHIDHAFEAEARAGGGGGDAMLAGARLGDDPLLAHAQRQQDLAEHIVDLVRAGVVQLLALEIDLRAAELFGHALGEIERARPADIMGEQTFQLGVIGRVLAGLVIGFFQRQDQRHQGFGDETAAENAEMAARVGPLTQGIGR